MQFKKYGYIKFENKDAFYHETTYKHNKFGILKVLHVKMYMTIHKYSQIVRILLLLFFFKKPIDRITCICYNIAKIKESHPISSISWMIAKSIEREKDGKYQNL